MQTILDYEDLDESYFPMMADILLNNCLLLINDKKYRLVEIEFYLKCNSHNDSYTHCNTDQLLMHTFYFHKFNTGTYKAGTFKGMDIIFGDKKTNSYFGILLRSIQNMANDEIIEGPCNVVNRILKEYNLNSIDEFTNYKNFDIFKNARNFRLVLNNDLVGKKIFFGPRIGLSDKYPEYQNRFYRFLTDKEKIKKKKSSLVELI